jgi:hypothetical protein
MAGTKPHQEANEAVAYFVQVALKRGVEPTALKGYDGRFASLIRQIYAAFKDAIRRVMRGKDINKLTAEDMVNMAYGAARLEVAGNWHGTAAAFRKFNSKFVGTGEGAQAYGWGAAYIAKRQGIGSDYHVRDVMAKWKKSVTDQLEKYADWYPKDEILHPVNRSELIPKDAQLGDFNPGKLAKKLLEAGVDYIDVVNHDTGEIERLNFNQRSIGNLMRVDHTVPDNAMMMSDLPVAKQHEHVRNVLNELLDKMDKKLPGEVTSYLDDMLDQANIDRDEITGHDFVGSPDSHFGKDGLLARAIEDGIFDDAPDHGHAKRAAAEYLNSLGVKGTKFYDSQSRGPDISAVNYVGNDRPDYFLMQRLMSGIQFEPARKIAMAGLRKDIKHLEASDGPNSASVSDARMRLEELNQAKPSDYQIVKRERTHNTIIFNDRNILRVASHPGGDVEQDLHGVKFGKTVAANISRLPDHLQEPARTITDRLNRWAGDALNHVVFTRDLVARGVAKGLTALEHYDTLREARDALAGHFQKMAFNAIEPVRKFTQEEKTGLSAFLQHSTLNGEWGYGPKATGKAKVMFDQLSDRAQSVAKAMFAHGDEILKEKKAVIEKKAAELYDDMLKGTTGAEREEILAEKNGFMKKYNTLMQIGEGKPYVPARRHGDWVVVGKSDAYLRAEERASRDGATREDKKALYDLVTDPQHYLVSEAQSEQESKALRQNMRDAGFPATKDHTYYKPKEDWQTELNGGKGVLAGMSRLRHQLEKLSQEAPAEADRMKYKTSARLLTNMWLDALSQSSSRKAEMRRMGVHGTMDMVGSFKQQAKGDAHFIAGITHNDAMLTQLKKAYKQADSGEGEDRTTKLHIYDEFMLRHEGSVNAVPTPWANKITKATALWQIATSPAHFIGNLMQPWTMTLPYLQAHHGYGKATSEFFKAYKEIGDILGKTGLLDTLKVSDMPADVRAPMQRLLELGRLDIGMNTEYGSMELRPKNMATRAAQAAADRVAQASLKMESLNRLASAAAAYRLEFAKHGDAERALHYAGDVVAETHGDHSRANAPRVFNNGFGKVALQFRKFQLVQLTQMVKMMGNLKNADPAERSIAVRHLVYTLAHVGVLGGALGMPGFGTFSAASQTLQKWLTGVDGQDWETKIEKAVGDRHIAQLLLRGVPGLLGVDLSKKVGYGDMLGIAPYTDVDPTDRKSVQDAIGQVTAGPFGGLVGRAAQSLHHMFVGNYYKGLEGLMPQGIANIMKGAREGGFAPTLGGVTNTKNDKLMDINAGEALLEAFGFEPSSKAMMQSETGAMIKSTEDFKNRLEILKERYNNDARSGSAGTSTAIKEMNDLRKEMVERGYRPTPLADILKTPIEQLKRQMFTTPGGVQYQPKQTGRAIDQLPK